MQIMKHLQEMVNLIKQSDDFDCDICEVGFFGGWLPFSPESANLPKETQRYLHCEIIVIATKS